MGAGRILVLALLAIAASLTLRLDDVLAAASTATAGLPEEKAGPSSRAEAAIIAERSLNAAQSADTAAADAADIETALLEAAARRARAERAPVLLSAETPPPPLALDPRMVQLTKMYSAMNPKDAARIFERLDLRVQVDVALAMRERPMAAILAEMEPEKASDLMMALAGAPRKRETH